MAPVVARVVPSVVNVYATRIVASRRRSLFDDPFFNQFFGDGFGRRGEPQKRTQESLGSGVVVDTSGLIVTNHHVIEDAEDLTVILSDRREFKARLVLDDARTDLAVLQLDEAPSDLQAIALQDSDQIAVGDLVLAVGNPFGVGQTVTSGIVSALARTQVGISDYQSFIQTDAAINPGNSGGALVDMNGQLIGVNTAIFSRSGGSVGIGFAIPANMVAQVIRAAQKGEKVVRPWLGAELQNISAELATAMGLDRPMGAVVTYVHPASSLARQGLQSGDVITAVDGVGVANVEELRYRVATRDIGTKLEFTYLRDGRRKQTKLTMIAPPDRPPRDAWQVVGQSVLQGARVANINPQLLEEFRLPVDRSGVIVVDVVRPSLAARFGFRVGDIVRSVDGTAITSVADMKDQETSFSRIGATVEIQRGERVLTGTVR